MPTAIEDKPAETVAATAETVKAADPVAARGADAKTAVAPVAKVDAVKVETKPEAKDVTPAKDGGTVLGGEKVAEKPAEKPVETKAAPIVLKAPEGATVDAKELEAVAAFATEHGLNQAQAEKVLARDLATRAEVVASSKAAMIEASRTVWVEQIKADKKYGGAKFAESAEIAKRAVDRFGTPALKEILNETGLGNHPELFRTFAKIGRLLADDKIIPAGTPAGGQSRMADRLYGGTAKQAE